MTDAEIAQLRATYYGMINEVEDNLARLIDQLKGGKCGFGFPRSRE